MLIRVSPPIIRTTLVLNLVLNGYSLKFFSKALLNRQLQNGFKPCFKWLLLKISPLLNSK